MYSVNMGGRYCLSVNIPLAFKKKKKKRMQTAVCAVV